MWSIPAAAPFQPNSLALSLWLEQLVASQLFLVSSLLQKGAGQAVPASPWLWGCLERGFVVRHLPDSRC